MNQNELREIRSLLALALKKIDFELQNSQPIPTPLYHLIKFNEPGCSRQDCNFWGNDCKEGQDCLVNIRTFSVRVPNG